MQYSNQYIGQVIEGTTSVFKGLTQKDKETLNTLLTAVQVKKGHFIFKEGEKTRGLICLATGKAKVYQDGVGGRGQIIKLVRPLGFIGYKALFSDDPWPFSAIALEDSAICIFERNSFRKFLKKSPEFSMKLMKIIVDELGFTNSRIISLTQKHVRGRLAESLLILRDTYGLESDGKTIQVAMSREDFASLSNMTTSNAIRTLSDMAHEGIIELNGRKVSIIDEACLEHISKLGS
jgi:CRP/FNR family transcriptional regulator, polysaccharide utilization system transcription regulator